MPAILLALKSVIDLLGIGGALQFLRALPDLIKIIAEIVKAIKEVKGAAQRREKTAQLKEALQEARESGDTSKLESLFK